MKLHHQELDSGLGIHLIDAGSTPTVTAMLAFEAGTRTERARENGMAHFLEHLAFKGGQLYSTPQLVNQAAESLGAELNAYTTHDLVAFYLTGRGESVMPMVDLLTDIVSSPRLDPEEIQRERGVVLQEIALHADDPAASVERLLDEAAFGDHPMGRSILGPPKHIKRFTQRQIREFRNRRWGAQNAGLYLAGNLQSVDRGQLIELASRVAPAQVEAPIKAAPPSKRRVLVRDWDTSLSHLGLQWRLPSGFDPSDPRQRAILSVYATVLGGATTSRLYAELRERRGICYSVEACAELHRDCTDLRVYTGIESKSCAKAYRRVCRTVKELRTRARPTAEEVERCRQVAAGDLVRDMEASLSLADHAAEQTIIFGRTPDPMAQLAALDSVTLGEVREIAECFTASPSVAAVGPHDPGDFS